MIIPWRVIKHRLPRVTIRLYCVGCALLLVAAKAANAQDEPLRQIVSDWLERQSRVQSVLVEWDEVQTQRRPVKSGDDSVTTTDVATAFRKSVVILRDKIRYRYEATSNAQPGQVAFDTSFDGEDSRSLSPAEPGREYPIGFIYPPAERLGVSNVHVKPIKLCFRPLDVDFENFTQEDLRLEQHSSVIQGSTCVGVRVSRPRGASNLVLWTRPDQEHSVVRCVYARGSVITRQIDIEYEIDSSFGPIPASWRVANYGRDGTLTLASSATVVRYEVNPPLTEADFQIKFPLGTMVTDTRDGKVVDYLVQRDNPQRLITPSEVRSSATYQQLLSTESGKAHLAHPARRVRWWFVGFAVIVCGSVMIVMVMKRYIMANR